MSLVKRIVAAGALLLLGFALGRADGIMTAPAAARATAAFRPAQADLAEAVFAMVMERAEKNGLSRPVTLCEACTAAHLGLAEGEIRGLCAKACGLR